MEFTVATKADAQTILKCLNDILDNYHFVFVADLKELIGLPVTYEDNKKGWSTLDGFVFCNSKTGMTGWDICLPEPIDMVLPEAHNKGETMNLWKVKGTYTRLRVIEGEYRRVTMVAFVVAKEPERAMEMWKETVPNHVGNDLRIKECILLNSVGTIVLVDGRN